MRRSSRKITVYYTGQSRYSINLDLCLRSSINMFSYGKGLKNNVLHQYMQMKSTDCDHKIYIGVEWFESFNVRTQKKSLGTCVNVCKEQVHIQR